MKEAPAETVERTRHWDTTYQSGGFESMSWFQVEPCVSLDLIEALEVEEEDSVIDVGGGASLLADYLIRRGWCDVTVLDISATALDIARERQADASHISFLHEDLLTWSPPRRYRLWHDRAVFHFLVDPTERLAYRRVLRDALAPDGAVILAAFAPDGPERCSGLPVARYSPNDLTANLGEGFELISTRREVHVTPSGASQPFSWIAARVSTGPATTPPAC